MILLTTGETKPSSIWLRSKLLEANESAIRYHFGEKQIKRHQKINSNFIPKSAKGNEIKG
jgi:hypothetical protein